MGAILFDLDDTLFDHALAMSAFLRAEFNIGGETLARVLALDGRGRGPREPFCAAVGALVDLPGAEVWGAVQRSFGGYARLTAPDVVARASERFVVGVLTNGGRCNQMNKVRALGLAQWIDPDHIIISAQVGVAKPDPRAFAAALDAIGGIPATTVFVGDDPVDDIAGARGAGMRCCWVARGRSFPDTPAPDWTIESIADLPSAWDEFPT